MKRRILALLLVLSMVMVWVPSSVFAAETASGTCGENLTWTLEDGVLTISGTGEMDSCYSGAPWADLNMQISEVVILDGVTSIGECAFYSCSSLSSITIPDSVASIGDSAFEECSSLTSIIIPDSVSRISRGMFFGCSGLTSITIPESVTSIGYTAFFKCSGLTSITIPESVTNIGIYAFYGCSGLTSVVIPEGVTIVEDSTFSCCSNLTSITIPESVTKIGWYAFSGCYSLPEIIIPDSVTSIGDHAFSLCRSLTNIIIPDSVTSIEEYAFSFCDSLTGIYVSTENGEYCNDEFGVLYNKDKTVLVAAPGAMKEYTIPNSVTSIGGGAFCGCSNLTNIAIPDSITSIGGHAFSNCSSLIDITIPESVASIGQYAFENCTNLASIIIPEGITSISEGMFVECSSLTSITIPEGVTSIGIRAFKYCGSLTDVYFCGTKEQWGKIELGDLNGQLKVANIHFGYILVEEHKHTWSTGEVTVTATCTTDGAMNYTCQICGETKTEIILATGHAWDNGSINKNPNTAEKCEVIYTCRFCGETKTVVVDEHDFKAEVVVPTCTEEGYTLHTCKNCGNSYRDTYIAETGHTWDDGVITKSPTTTEQGEKTYTCTVCGETKTEAIAVLSNPFTDLVENSSYYDPVLWAVKNGITTGTSDTEFSPKADCTRAQIVTFLWRCAGKPEPATAKHNFVDLVENSSYYKAVLWAVEKGITTGLDKTHFGPKETCTRAQIVTFLWRAAGEPEPSSQKHSFEDIVKPSSYYDAVLWAVEKGITTGADATHFAPKDTCTRAQGMTFLYRYHNNK